MKPSVTYRFHSLEDFLTSKRLDVDGLLDDGWGAHFPVKGRVIDAVIVFVDIGAFSRRTFEMSPIETLIFVNNFFSWITAEGLRERPGVVDKYIGDEIMVVFSKEFGSDDPFADALITARWMAERDALAFCPHIGLAQGEVCVGYVGTPLRYNCSVFGRPVTIASRCCGADSDSVGNSIFLPADLWGKRNLNDYFKPERIAGPSGKIIERRHHWEVSPVRKIPIKNMPDLEIVEITNSLIHMPSLSADDRAKMGFEGLKTEGTYNPIRYGFERD
ncbi:MAG: adenylate/guanylate cyclase domain-containing protein [Verrucomicrobiales bacterium]|nr:adenylate/guanylate cyclase domain-containing protein [Verrucomicrobiales bacterium]